ncbi:hypothetical protein MTO96_051396 [Rhipicephalus appendiculatus]
MADVDIRRLCTICDDLPPGVAAVMDLILYPLLVPMILVVDDDPIYRSLKAIANERERLERMVTMYSWLLPRSLHTVWALYSVHRISSVLDAHQIGLELARKVRSVDESVAEAVHDLPHGWCLTIMTTQGARSPSKYIPISINVWSGLPFVAIHIQDMTGPDATNWPLLESVVGDLEKGFCGFYSSLDSAHSAAAS